MAQLNFNIEDICGTLSENKDGWRKELTYISWNNRAAKFDLRSWDPDYQAMTILRNRYAGDSFHSRKTS